MNTIGIDCDSKQITAVCLNDRGEFCWCMQIHSEKKEFKDRFAELVHKLECNSKPLYFLSIDQVRLAIEESIYIQNAKATINIAKVTGYVQSTAIREGVPWATVDNRIWKKSIIGHGNASKEDVMDYAKKKWGLVIGNEHMADASCIALWGVNNYEKFNGCP